MERLADPAQLVVGEGDRIVVDRPIDTGQAICAQDRRDGHGIVGVNGRPAAIRHHRRTIVVRVVGVADRGRRGIERLPVRIGIDDLGDVVVGEICVVGALAPGIGRGLHAARRAGGLRGGLPFVEVVDRGSVAEDLLSNGGSGDPYRTS